MKSLFFLVLPGVIGGFTHRSRASSSLPTVDLGYEVHQAISFNVRSVNYPDAKAYYVNNDRRKTVAFTTSVTSDMRSLPLEPFVFVLQNPRPDVTQSSRSGSRAESAHKPCPTGPTSPDSSSRLLLPGTRRRSTSRRPKRQLVPYRSREITPLHGRIPTHTQPRTASSWTS